ncbi:MAG: hypothetical protein HC859_04145 [Bacteroidia bacterium]|nr:hypothetical protein [Bacteroidia bacterium]
MRFFFSTFLLFASLCAFAQSGLESSVAQRSVADSLTAALRSSQGRERVDLLERLAFEYRFSKPEQALAYIRQGMHLADSANYEAGKAKIFSLLGIIKKARGKYDSAVYYYEKALALERKLGNAAA